MGTRHLFFLSNTCANRICFPFQTFVSVLENFRDIGKLVWRRAAVHRDDVEEYRRNLEARPPHPPHPRISDRLGWPEAASYMTFERIKGERKTSEQNVPIALLPALIRRNGKHVLDVRNIDWK